ncbi:MAG TPA: DUF2341 domain-containing protein, partial [Thermoplasmatales archaeon]|nr:DUF2341 domain-containing protein [Thermoplasmatales archaeon]HEX17395.1 DUF2341 domain-containing protein [Thermoplasmatales archaeon]
MRILRDKKAVSEVVGFVLILSIASVILTLTIYTSSYIMDQKVREVATYQARAIANQVADAIVDAVWMKRSLPDASYERILDLPRDIGGLDYYIELTSDAIYVNSTDGSVSERSTTYKAGDLGIGLFSKVYGGSGRLKIICEPTKYLYRFDFGVYHGVENQTVNFSSVELGYYRVSNNWTLGNPNEEPDWADPSLKYRIPIIVRNVGNDTKNISKYWIKITLSPAYFDYGLANESGYDLAIYNFTGKRLPCWIEKWNPRGLSTVWFMIDNISRNETRYFYLYFGNKDPTVDWDYLFTPDNSTEDIYNKFSDDNLIFFDDFDNQLEFINNWTIEGDAEIVDNEYVKLSYVYDVSGNGTVIITRKNVTVEPGMPERINTTNATMYFIEAKVKVSDDVEQRNKTADVDLLPAVSKSYKEGSKVQSGINTSMAFVICLPQFKNSSEIPNATSIWVYTMGNGSITIHVRIHEADWLHGGSTYQPVSGKLTDCLNSSVGTSIKDRWSILKVKLYRARGKNETGEPFRITAMEVKCIDNDTSQIYNYLTAGYLYGDYINVSTRGEASPSYVIARISRHDHLGFGCGLFCDLVNETYGFNSSEDQEVYIDWVKVRRIVVPEPVVYLGGIESLNYG